MGPESRFHDVNGLRYHVQVWGGGGSRRLILLHGWNDSGLTFQFLADELIDRAGGDLEVVAPDWRGFGQSEWANGNYWFPDYYADLDRLLDIYSPDEPAAIVGHSMGGHIACMYAGIRPARVGRLVAIEGLGLRPIEADEAPERFGRWLDQQNEEPRSSRYDSVDHLAEKLRRRNQNLDEARAVFVAEAWLKPAPAGTGFVLKSDPRHKRVNPVLYRHEEVIACWRRIQAPMMSITGEVSGFTERYEETGVLDLLSEIKEDFETLVVPGAGHMLHHEHPDQLADAIHEWTN